MVKFTDWFATWVIGNDKKSLRGYNTIIEGDCQYCRSSFTFDPNITTGCTPFDGATDGNWKWVKEKGKKRKYAVCPYCGHHNKTDIWSD